MRGRVLVAAGLIALPGCAPESRANVTTGPAGSVACFLPMAIPHCRYPFEDQHDVTENPPAFTMTEGNADTVTWALPDANPNTTTLNARFGDFCGESNHQVLEVGDPIHVGNGVNTPMVIGVADLINDTNGDGAAFPWPSEAFPDGAPARDGQPGNGFAVRDSLIDDDRWGYVLHGPIPLVDVGGVPGDCSGQGQLTGDPVIVGFTYGFLFDAGLGSDALEGFKVQLDYVNDYDFGITVDPDALGNVTADSPPQLVR